jgi:hypothetical protein
MTTAPPALPGRAWNKRLKESHELTRLLLVKADMRVVIAKDIAGNNAISAEQTVASGGGMAFSPDGTISVGGSGPPLVNAYGTWTWGPQVANPGINPGEANGWFWLNLNGKTVAYSSQNEVNFGGQFFQEQFDANIFYYLNYFFVIDNSPVISDPGPHPQPIIQGPFTSDPDGSSITAPNGTLATDDGVWTWGTLSSGTDYNVLLNGIPASFAATTLTIDSHGTLFVLSGGQWQCWINYFLFNPEVPPTSAPMPKAISMSPSFISGKSWMTGHAGDVITTVTVTMSDGSPFAGSYTFNDVFGSTGLLTMSGNNVVLQRDMTSADASNGLAQFILWPSQNGVQLRSGANFFDMRITS